MENLEKIDLIRERLHVSYEQANQALQEAGGDVIQALVNLEKEREKEQEKNGFEKENVFQARGQELIDKIKSIINKGNVNKIAVKDDDKVLLEIPVTAGVASLVIFPYITILGGMAAMFKEYTLEIEKENNNNCPESNEEQSQRESEEPGN